MRVLVDFLVEYQTAITALVGALIGTAWIWRRLLAPIAQLVEAQLQPNGGGSLVDKVAKIEPNHAAAEAHWKSMEVSLENLSIELHRRMGAVEDELDTRKRLLLAAVDQMDEPQRSATKSFLAAWRPDELSRSQ